jgi:hypothetical protein
VITFAVYDIHIGKLNDTVRRLHAMVERAGIEYRVIGGLAVFLHVSTRDMDHARATNDIDVAVDRRALARIAEIANQYGFRYRHASGVDMLVDAVDRRNAPGIHFVFVREKVRPEHPEPVPDFSQPVRTEEGLLLAPVVDLVHMKLTSFHLKDKVHIQDMDKVGLITPDIEATLSPILRERLAEVRATE